jgi:hypothetical protein
LLLRILPTLGAIGLACLVVRPAWQPITLGLVLAVPVAVVLAIVWSLRLREAGIPRGTFEEPTRVQLEVRIGSLLAWLAALAAIGVAAGAVESRWDVGIGEFGASIVVPIVLLGLGLSLRPKTR